MAADKHPCHQGQLSSTDPNRGGDSFPILTPSAWLSHAHTCRASSTMLPRLGIRPTLLRAGASQEWDTLFSHTLGAGSLRQGTWSALHSPQTSTWPRLGISAWPLVIAWAMEIDTNPSCCGDMYPVMALSGNPGEHLIMASVNPGCSLQAIPSHHRVSLHRAQTIPLLSQLANTHMSKVVAPLQTGGRTSQRHHMAPLGVFCPPLECLWVSSAGTHHCMEVGIPLTLK